MTIGTVHSPERLRALAMKRSGPRPNPHDRAQRHKAAIRTLTATKKKLNQGVHETRGGSESAFRKHNPKPHSLITRLASQAAKLIYVTNDDAIFDGTAGVQVVKDVQSLVNNVDMQAMMTRAFVQQFGPTASVPGFGNARIYIKNCISEVMYNNNTNDQVRLLLFDIVPRQDIYFSANDPISPTAAFMTGMVQEDATTTPPISPYSIVGALPFASHMFTHYFRILKITNVTLAPGQTHYHRIKFDINHVADNVVLQQGNVGLFKNLSLSHMCIQYGAPTLDSTTTNVTTQATKVLMVRRAQYEFSYVPSNITSLSYSNKLLGTAGTMEENMVTGAAAVFAKV